MRSARSFATARPLSSAGFAGSYKVADNCGPEITAYMNELWDKQLTKREIASVVGIREATLQDRIKYYRPRGLFAPRPCDNDGNIMTEGQWKQWRKWWKANLSFTQIAKLADVSERSVRRRIMKARIRNPGWFPYLR